MQSAGDNDEREPFWWDDTGHEMTFVENMRMLRSRRGMSQTELAKRASEQGLGFHQPTIQRIETGQRPLKLTESMIIARLLGSTLEQMMNDVSLPSGYRLLVDEMSFPRLQPTLARLVAEKGVSFTRSQIEESFADYREAARHFGVEPPSEVIARAELVLERLGWVQEAVTAMSNTVADIAAELAELEPLPSSAHGGTPWDEA